MQHSHNTTHTHGNNSFLVSLSSRDRFPGSKGGVYSISLSFAHNLPASSKAFISQSTLNAIAPLDSVKMQVLAFNAGAGRIGATAGGSLMPSRSIVTKTTTEQTPYPELFVSPCGSGQVTNTRRSLKYPLV